MPVVPGLNKLGFAMRKYIFPIVLILLSLAVLSGCAHQGWRFKWGAPTEVASADEGAEEAQPDATDDAEADLRRLVAREVRAEERNGGPSSAGVTRLRPYYLREYVEYPDGAESFEVVLQDTESRTSPLKADVRLDKVRYATKLHRDRKLAASDDDFIRSTGIEVITYEHRMGRWRRMGSTFVASKTEEMKNGEWVPVRRNTEAPTAPEPRRGWFKRTFGFITGD